MADPATLVKLTERLIMSNTTLSPKQVAALTFVARYGYVSPGMRANTHRSLVMRDLIAGPMDARCWTMLVVQVTTDGWTALRRYAASVAAELVDSAHDAAIREAACHSHLTAEARAGYEFA